MKAWLWERYGPPEALRLANVESPSPGPGEVLVEVKAASVNAADWRSMRGKPLFSRLTLGPFRPKHRSLGVDVAGVVTSVGEDVTKFNPGDEVYANLLEHGYGGFAEYVAVPVGALARKPADLSFAEASAVPMAGGTALQGLRHHGPVTPDQRVLVNGGSGGVGSFAVQIARSFGPSLTVVTSPKNVDLAERLGADRVIDYTTTDFTSEGERYDLILDTVGNRSVSDLRRALGDGGKAAVTGFTDLRNLMGTSLRGGNDVTQVSAHVGAPELDELSALIVAGHVRPVIDRMYSFSEIPDAIGYLEQGHASGKVVATVP